MMIVVGKEANKGRRRESFISDNFSASFAERNKIHLIKIIFETERKVSLCVGESYFSGKFLKLSDKTFLQKKT